MAMPSFAQNRIFLQQPFFLPNVQAGEPFWNGPTSYDQVVNIINNTGQFSLIIWIGHGCSWCEKLQSETLSKYLPLLSQQYIIYFADINVEPKVYNKFAARATTYYYPLSSWDGKCSIVPIMYLIGPYGKDSDVVVYGACVGYVNSSEFVKWHNSIVEKWNLKVAPDYYRWNAPPQSLQIIAGK